MSDEREEAVTSGYLRRKIIAGDRLISSNTGRFKELNPMIDLDSIQGLDPVWKEDLEDSSEEKT